MSYKKKCEKLIEYFNKKGFETENQKLDYSCYNPDNQNRIRLVLKEKVSGGESSLSNVFLSYSAFYDALYMLENVLSYKREVEK